MIKVDLYSKPFWRGRVRVFHSVMLAVFQVDRGKPA